MNYNDILSMPVYERRFFISLLVKDVQKREEEVALIKEQAHTTNGKNKRTSRVSGEALKTRMRNGDVPIK